MRLKAVGEVLVNLVVSFLLLVVFDMGIYGVLFGTTISMVSICIWWEIMAVHKYSLKASAKRYVLNFIGYMITAGIGCFASYFVSMIIPYGGILGFLLAGIAAMVIFGIILLSVYGRSRPFKALLGRFFRR